MIEVLVVVAVVCVLIALLVPAIQKVRESAARAHCQNDLGNLGLGLVNYQFTHRAFPPGGTTAPKQHSWATYLLPFIEQGNLQRRFDWNSNWYDPPNAAAAGVDLKASYCWSDPSSP